MKIVISSAHSTFISGAKGLIDEVEESRRVVPQVAAYLNEAGHIASTWDDNVSNTQAANLAAIVAHHNAQQRDLDISVHFNAFAKTAAPRGTEVLYVSQLVLAALVAQAISQASGLINRGAKHRTNLAFLSRTQKPAILIEVCFVDSSADVDLYRKHFDPICKAIAATIGAVKSS